MENLLTLLLLNLFLSTAGQTDDNGESKVDTAINSFLTQQLTKTFRTYGVEGSDCGGLFYKYEIEYTNSYHYLIQSRWDCGVNGFEKNTFLVKANKLVVAKRFVLKPSESNKFVATEKIMNFEKDSIEIMEREKKALNVSDTLLNEYKFKIRKVADNGESRKILGEIKELESSHDK